MWSWLSRGCLRCVKTQRRGLTSRTSPDRASRQWRMWRPTEARGWSRRRTWVERSTRRPPPLVYPKSSLTQIANGRSYHRPTTCAWWSLNRTRILPYQAQENQSPNRYGCANSERSWRTHTGEDGAGGFELGGNAFQIDPAPTRTGMGAPTPKLAHPYGFELVGNAFQIDPAPTNLGHFEKASGREEKLTIPASRIDIYLQQDGTGARCFEVRLLWLFAAVEAWLTPSPRWMHSVSPEIANEDDQGWPFSRHVYNCPWSKLLLWHFVRNSSWQTWDLFRDVSSLHSIFYMLYSRDRSLGDTFIHKIYRRGEKTPSTIYICYLHSCISCMAYLLTLTYILADFYGKCIGKFVIHGLVGWTPWFWYLSGPPKQKQRHPSNPKRYATVAVGVSCFRVRSFLSEDPLMSLENSHCIMKKMQLDMFLVGKKRRIYHHLF